MMANVVLLKFLVILLLVAQIQCSCTPDSSLTGAEKSAVEDIIKLLDPMKSQTYDVASGDIKYKVSVCGDDAEDSMPQSAVVKVNGSSAVPIGLGNMTLGVKGADWVEVVWLSNVNYTSKACPNRRHSARLLVTCDQDVREASPPLKLDSIPEVSCFSSFSTSHSLACISPKPPPHMGSFSVFLIVVSVLGGVYLLVGGAYMRFVKGARGVDQVPHKLFWFRVGNAFADCTGALCRCDKRCGDSTYDDYAAVSGGAGAYSDVSPASSARSPPYQSGGPVLSNEGRTGDLLGPPNRGSSDTDLLQP